MCNIKITIIPNGTVVLSAAFFIWNRSFAKLLLSVILHECGHCLAAFIIGKRNLVFAVSPLGCSLYVGSLSGKVASLFVYAAGPFASLLLAPILSPQTLWILAFNLIPMLPLDGGRIAALFWGEKTTSVLGGLTLLFGLWSCVLKTTVPFGIIVILILHNRYVASERLEKIRYVADSLRDLY